MKKKLTKEYIEWLGHRYREGKIAPEERAEFEEWYAEQLEKEVVLTDDGDGDAAAIKRKLYQNIESRLGFTEGSLDFKGNEERVRRQGMSRRMGWMAVAASVTLVSLGIWLFGDVIKGLWGGKQDSHKSEIVNLIDFAPGKNTATLRLATGKVFLLDTNKTSVVVEDSIKNLSLADAATTVVASTPRGGQYQLVLPDGSRVWLNAASSISFPSSFAGLNKRIVRISGEAYFEVAHNKEKPFVVEASGQEVEVLGTHFNINSYADEGETKTTLIEGSVLVSSLRDEVKQSQLLKPNQQAILVNNIIQVKSVDAQEAVAWKDGYFDFTDATIETIMRQISRWYDVEVEFVGPISTEKFNGRISRFRNISQVLKIVQLSNAVQLKFEGRRIMVSN